RFSAPLSLLFISFCTPPRALSSLFSLHDALPIFMSSIERVRNTWEQWRLNVAEKKEQQAAAKAKAPEKKKTIAIGRIDDLDPPVDRKSTRLNSSHVSISYAVFCLKKKMT